MYPQKRKKKFELSPFLIKILLVDHFKNIIRHVIGSKIDVKVRIPQYEMNNKWLKWQKNHDIYL
jgi:hypothetical protein